MKGSHKNNDGNDKCDKCKKYKKGPLKFFEFNLPSDNASVINMPSEPKIKTAIYRLKLEKIKENEGNENMSSKILL